MAFKDLSKDPVKIREQELFKYWEEINLLDLVSTEREDGDDFIFYDGPPTANGEPGIHHVISRALKDITNRYKTMSGYKVMRKAGWDTHGLPVEIEVEKQLGLESKQEIEDYGIEKFNKKCRESVFKYEDSWRRMSDRMAYLVDMDDPYITLDNDYIETNWWILDQIAQKDLIYKGAKILPYCGRCGTGLASHEVAQGYQEITTDSITVAFKRKDSDEHFLAWTTTPWTLPSNVALTVHPDLDYVLVKSHGHKFWVANELKSQFFNEEEIEILKTVKGKELEYVEYEQLIPFYEAKGKAFYITLADYVTLDSGTGIVHSAPAFGEEDYEMGREYNLPMINPVDKEGKFVGGEWDGNFVIDADPAIIEYLRDKEVLFKKEEYNHNYPHCWRCDTPLIYTSNPSWYIEVTKYQDQLIKNNNGVNWYPDFVGERRFGNWLENLKDWAISRSRFWGTPLNIWVCDDCEDFTTVGSREELRERAQEEVDKDIELHRPYVDDITLKCEKCDGTMHRVPDVVDVWFDSGAMPFSQVHYPFEHEDDFEHYFPADFICEGIDQTRGWFYSLLAISTLVTGKAPYKNVLVNDLVLDDKGQKMSKSRGNTLDPFELFDEYGADAIRFYSIYVSPAWVPTRFDIEGLKEVQSQFFRTLRNTYHFFQMYAEIDDIDPREFDIPVKERPLIDRWILSRFHSMVKRYKENMDIFEYTRVVREMTEFLVDDVSNWYIRRNRRRFWAEDLTEDKRSVYKTTYEILLGVTKLIAPFTPYIAEELYLALTDGKTVHLEYIPEMDESLIDLDLEKQMGLVRDLVVLGRASREQAQIKNRQPLSQVIIDAAHKDTIGDLDSLICEELNIKKVSFRDDLDEYMDYDLKPNFQEVGKILGPKVPSFQKFLQEVNEVELLDQLNENDKVNIDLDGEVIEIDKNFVDVRISAREGFDVEMANNLFVILDTTLNDELLDEGYMREMISKVQSMRRSEDFELMDKIEIRIRPTERIQKVINKFENEIKNEVLAEDILLDTSLDADNAVEEDLNGEEVFISIKKL